MNLRLILLFLNVIIFINQNIAQSIQSGKVITGFIECIVIDSTEHAMMEASMIQEMSSIIPRDTLYFNEEYSILVQKSDSKTIMMEYENRKTGLIYKFYNDSSEKVYTIDSSNYYFLQDSIIAFMMDTIKNRIDKMLVTAKKSTILGLECYEIVNPEYKKNEEGYQKLFLTKDLAIRPRDNPSRKIDGFSVRMEISAAVGVEIAMGIIDWEKIPSDDPIFNLPLKEYTKISNDEFYEKVSY